MSTVSALCVRKLIIPSDNLVGSTLDDRIHVVSFKGQDEHNKIYLAKNSSTGVYYEMRAYPFDKVGNKGKKILWRDCQEAKEKSKVLGGLEVRGEISFTLPFETGHFWTHEHIFSAPVVVQSRSIDR